MALDCRIIVDENGSIDYINTEEGTRSTLFDNLVKASNKEVALDLYALTETEEFKAIHNSTAEPTVQAVLSFAAQRDSTLTDIQRVDVENTILSAGLGSYGELLNKLKGIFYKKGLVVFDRDSMLQSEFYNEYEASSVMESLELQDRIRNTIYALANTSSERVPDYDPLFVLSETSRLNSLGKQIVSNPYTIENRVTEQIAGTDVSESLGSVPFESIKNSYLRDAQTKAKLNRIAAQNKVIKEKEIVNGEIVDKTTDRTYELLNEVLDLSSRWSITQKLNYVLSISPGVWNISQSSMYTLLKDINERALDSGVDMLNLEDTAYTNSRDEIVNMLTAYKTVLNTPTDENLQAFSEAYSEFFALSQEPVTRIVPTNDANDIYLDSELSEYELFTEHGLIKKADNLYRPVQVIENVDEVYAIMAANTALLPEGVQNEEELKDYVNSKLTDIEVPDFRADAQQLEKMILYKMYFRASDIRPPVANNTAKYQQFTGNYQYLTEEYPSDFYKELLKEKRANSDLYQNFYRNFTVTKNGIELINNDPITVQQIMRYAPDYLKQYNLLSKSLNLPLENNGSIVDFNEMIYNRQQAVSNPESVAKLNKDYTILSPITIAVKNENSNFVRTPAGVFEIDYQIGNVSFYNILPKGDTRYNSFGLHRTKTQSDLNLDDFTYLQDTPEVFTRAQSYYSAAELKRINEKHFGCL